MATKVSLLEKGNIAPEFCLPDKDRNTVCLKDLRSKWVVLYFYPKDNTSGCTLEAIDFTRELDDFKSLNTVILGVSPDSPESHCRFYDKHNLKVTLLSDTEKEVLQQYGAWGTKKMYGKEYQGVIRTTCLVDPDGKIAKVWNNVKVNGHVNEVMDTVKSLQGE
ncbi:MAG TPA: thioredoxin-dependent thiol peroxidase [Spirochaetota bacterium]|nr:thioredoxin-dependent thiol peroxidase [Spirochaetota bacterium]